MKRLIHLLIGLALAFGAASAQAQRVFNQAELDSLLAPIALYPDPLLNHILNAAVYPDDVQNAAAWMRANPQLQGDAALATVQGTLWHPSVKALVAYPDVLIRISESPQWLADVGEAYRGIPQYVDATVQQLRARASANGYLRSDDYQYVYQQGPTIVVQPVYPTVVYARYYDPLVVYGTWWWPAYRPAYFRPWAARPVYAHHYYPRYERPGYIRQAHAAPISHAPRQVQVIPWHNVPESQRRPIIQSAPAVRSLPSSPPPSGHWRAAPLVQQQVQQQAQHQASVVRAPAAQPAPRLGAAPEPRRSNSGHSNDNHSGGGHWLSGRLK
ncbi:MAG TPA: DUF3300 domain-containing protein [Burkholderiales bacterium]